MSDMSDKDLFNELIEAIDKCGFVFWTCPNKCNTYVDWNEDKTQATCRECGKLSTDS
jgi:hypothetical protein